MPVAYIVRITGLTLFSEIWRRYVLKLKRGMMCVV